MPRALEIPIAVVGLLLVLPLLLIIAVAVQLADGSPVLYRARRVGLNGTQFDLLKFRTMCPGADNQRYGLTTKNDPRITPLGEFLRRFKLDELPQLINVLRSEMSFVGPRPEDPRYVSLYSEEQKQVLKFRPGITSPASLSYKDEASLLGDGNGDRTYVEMILPHKLKLDHEYFSRRTLASDLGLIFQTIGGIVR